MMVINWASNVVVQCAKPGSAGAGLGLEVHSLLSTLGATWEIDPGKVEVVVGVECF